MLTKEKPIAYDNDGTPLYALTRKQTIIVYSVMALGLIVLSAVVAMIVRL